ncbi:MAG: hypothetical protein LUQ47_03135, partial [Methanotrichaceae archaeon]|nr:hypothetical protein [Methanotrichaceae archaeon]
MKNILAITVALMIAAVLLMPAMGYTIKSPGNQSYSFVSGPRINYSIGMGIPAHNLTPEMIVVTKRTIMPAVTTTRVPFSFNIVPRTAAIIPAVQTIKQGQPAQLETVGMVTKPVEAAANITAPVVEAAANITAPVVEAAANITAPVVEAAANITAPVVEAAPVNVTEPVVIRSEEHT